MRQRYARANKRRNAKSKQRKRRKKRSREKGHVEKNSIAEMNT